MSPIEFQKSNIWPRDSGVDRALPFPPRSTQAWPRLSEGCRPNICFTFRFLPQHQTSIFFNLSQWTYSTKSDFRCLRLQASHLRPRAKANLAMKQHFFIVWEEFPESKSSSEQSMHKRFPRLSEESGTWPVLWSFLIPKYQRPMFEQQGFKHWPSFWHSSTMVNPLICWFLFRNRMLLMSTG